MSEQQQSYDWNESRTLDDTKYDAADADLFRSLLDNEKNPEIEKNRQMKIGSILSGKIVNISKDYFVIDVGLKSEALVAANEFKYDENLEIGQDVDVLLEKAEDENGQVKLSRERARYKNNWDNIVNNYSEGDPIQGKVIKKVKGGLIVDIGIEAFLPGSQVSNKRIKNLDEYIGQTYDLKILKVNLERKNIVVSRRELLETERKEKKNALMDKIQPGDFLEGSVKNITDFGAFIDLDGVDGLLHITDISWKRIKHPSEILSVDEKLEVIVLNIDKDKGRIALGLKQKDPNPWEEVERKYPIGTKISGTIVNLLPYGAFIEIEPGIEGLIHVSEMSWVKNVINPSEIVNKGDVVDAVVLGIQKDEGKLSLGMKQIELNPWDDIKTKYPIETVVDAEVRSLTNYGAFVMLELGIEGLVHVSDMSWTKKISHPSEMLKKGDKIKAMVLSVDEESKKITLGLKQLEDNPWDAISETQILGSMVSGIVTRTTAFGAFVLLDNGIEALIHVSELSDEPFGKVEDVISKDDKVTAKIVSIDPENKKIALSLKDIDESKDDIVVSKKEKKTTKKATKKTTKKKDEPKPEKKEQEAPEAETKE